MIELLDVHKVFNQGRHNELRAVKGIDLVIERGQVTVLKGPSGSGKTTLLTIVGCLARPTRGRVRLEGRDISGLPERFLTELRRRSFGFVFQQYNLIKGLTALENVMIPAYPTGRPHGEVKTAAVRALETLDLGDRLQARVEWLSGGEAQRVAIARAMINDPPYIIADEPTANLDSQLSGSFLGIVETLKGMGKTLILSSHDPIVTQAAIVDHAVSMRDGMTVPA